MFLRNVAEKELKQSLKIQEHTSEKIDKSVIECSLK